MFKNIAMRQTNFLDIAKGFAILFVVLGHVIQFSFPQINNEYFNNILYKAIYSFHMPLFIFLSGFLFYKSSLRRSLTMNLINKIKGIGGPYVIWTTVLVIVFIMSDLILADTTLDVSKTFLVYLEMLLINPSYWFLFVLLLIILIMSLCISLKRVIGIVAYPSIVIIMFLIPSQDILGIYYIKWLFLYFLIGFITAKYYIRLFNLSLVNFKFFLIATSLFLFMILFWNYSDYVYINKMTIDSNYFWSDLLRYFYRYTMGFLGIYIVCCIANFIQKYKISKLICIAGVLSLDIYLIQKIVIERLYPMILQQSGFVFYDQWYFILLCILGCIVGTGICVLFSTIIRTSRILSMVLLPGR